MFIGGAYEVAEKLMETLGLVRVEPLSGDVFLLVELEGAEE